MQDEPDIESTFNTFRRPHVGQVNFRPDDFRDHVVIGRGKDSTIYSAKCDPLGGRTVAVKLYNKGKLSASKLRAIKREAAMMGYITRKGIAHVTRLKGAFQDANQVWLVMELGEGGDLLEKLLAEGRAMSESHVCQRIAVPLLKTLQELHNLHIIHRDLKLENIFLSKDGDVMLGDFGLTMSTKQELAVSPVGTVEYMAPEVVALPPVDAVTRGLVRTCDITPCTDRVDIWALGVTCYELLTGHLPFEGRDKAEVKRSIAAGRLRPLPSSVSPEATDFVVSMLEYDPARRPSAGQLLEHPYVKKYMQIGTLPMSRDDTAHDLEMAPDKKVSRLQGQLGELGRTSFESGPLIMARHGSPFATLVSSQSSGGGSSIASEANVPSLTSSDRSRSSPSPTRMSRNGRGPAPGRMRPHGMREARPSGIARPHMLARHPLDTAASSTLPAHITLTPTPARPSTAPANSVLQQTPKEKEQQAAAPSALNRVTSFMKTLFGAESWDAAPATTR